MLWGLWFQKCAAIRLFAYLILFCLTSFLGHTHSHRKTQTKKKKTKGKSNLYLPTLKRTKFVPMKNCSSAICLLQCAIGFFPFLCHFSFPYFCLFHLYARTNVDRWAAPRTEQRQWLRLLLQMGADFFCRSREYPRDWLKQRVARAVLNILYL